MECSITISRFNYSARREGLTAASAARDPPAGQGRSQMHTEHPAQRRHYQELRRTEHSPTRHIELQQKSGSDVGLGCGSCQRLPADSPTRAPRHSSLQDPDFSHSIQRPNRDSQS